MEPHAGPLVGDEEVPIDCSGWGGLLAQGIALPAAHAHTKHDEGLNVQTLLLLVTVWSTARLFCVSNHVATNTSK